MEENVITSPEGEVTNYYPIHVSTANYKNLFTIQATPKSKILFKDTEITMEQLVEILQSVPWPEKPMNPLSTAVPDFVIARMCHEVNKAWCEINGDNSQKPWEDSPEWQRLSALRGVRWKLENPNASASSQHAAWLKDKQDEGWIWGSEKNVERKEHPCIMPYEELPTVQKKKDALFIAIVNALK